MNVSVDIIQVYKLSSNIKKPEYNNEIRERLMQWPKSLYSHTGSIKNQKLILPIEKKDEVNNAGLLILHDVVDFDPELIENALLPERFKNYSRNGIIHNNPELYVFKHPSTTHSFQIFKLEKAGESYNLFLNYSNSDIFIGQPERDDHKIAELRKNKPVRYRINGKNDFSASGRRQRSYMEYDYIIEYSGTVYELEFKDRHQINCEKHPQVNDVKLIDERKILY